MLPFYEIRIISEQTISIFFGDVFRPDIHDLVMAFTDRMRCFPPVGCYDIAPAYNSVTIHYNPLEIPRPHSPSSWMRQYIEQTLLNVAITPREQKPIIEVPVRYNGQDLTALSDLLCLSIPQIISTHSQPVYTVYMTGFLPGFPYMGILPEKLEVPRHATPRLRVPAGSVAIAGRQTGIYPFESPGGWQLLGQCTVPLFTPSKPQAALLQVGDRVKFMPI